MIELQEPASGRGGDARNTFSLLPFHFFWIKSRTCNCKKKMRVIGRMWVTMQDTVYLLFYFFEMDYHF